jgi:hypothetical protein
VLTSKPLKMQVIKPVFPICEYIRRPPKNPVFFGGFVFSLRPVFASFARLRGYWWGYW